MPNPRDPSMSTIPTLGPKVCKYYLLCTTLGSLDPQGKFQAQIRSCFQELGVRFVGALITRDLQLGV